MCVSGEGRPAENLTIDNNERITDCREYTYLGVKLTDSGRTEQAINDKIAKERMVTKSLNQVLWEQNIANDTKIKVMFKKL